MAKTGMSPEELYFRDQLREARAAALKDAEGFIGICRCLERLAYLATREDGGLGQAWRPIRNIVCRSPLAVEIPSHWPELHPRVKRLYHSVRQARNQAVHEGAFARNLTRQAVELALIVEDALQESAMLVQDFMVRDPVVAELWEPISFIRQKMLVNAFSFLPVRDGSGGWHFVSDRALARYLRAPTGEDGETRKTRLAKRLGEVVGKGVDLEKAETRVPETSVTDLAPRIGDQPILIVGESARLLGIVTAFDLM